LVAIGPVVSEEKIKVYDVRRPEAAGCQVMAKAHLACLWPGELKMEKESNKETWYLLVNGRNIYIFSFR
jgi:hypothetical protein